MNVRAHRSGFALVFVLSVLVAMSVLGEIILHQMHSATVVLSSEADIMAAGALLDGAVNDVILGVVDGGKSFLADFSGAPKILTLFGSSISVQITDEAGKIDLNSSSARMLAALFRTQGVEPFESEELAAEVAAWRSSEHPADEDAAMQLYRSAGLRYGPRHSLFRSTGELRLVFGMTSALQAAVEPFVTVYSPNASINVATAADGVLAALEEVGDQFAAARRVELRERLDSQDWASWRSGALTIQARVVVGSVAAERTAVVNFARLPNGPYQVLSWH